MHRAPTLGAQGWCCGRARRAQGPGTGGFGRSTQGHGLGRGCGPGHRAHRGKAEDKEGIPVTKLGRLVKDVKIKSLEAIDLFSLPTRESEITDSFLGASLRDEVWKTLPVQKQTPAGHRTRLKALVAVGDDNGHVGLGGASEGAATAFGGAAILATLSGILCGEATGGARAASPTLSHAR
ncbi:40S ribosomal protein S2-like [Mirounga leonina]|uniref:40S ribosomal protein S2-like n=1 Tax=Mirounga leonina TaxID=9715 RepID=UPI00156C082A|nr:40S ribosomal protein S2-like [Mirounga leonina]